MNARLIKRLALLSLAVCLLCVCTCISESYSAFTMRLLHYDGDVVIEDASGEARFVLANVRFNSGEAMRTGPGGSASVALDDTKIVTLDEGFNVHAVAGNLAGKAVVKIIKTRGSFQFVSPCR